MKRRWLILVPSAHIGAVIITGLLVAFSSENNVGILIVAIFGLAVSAFCAFLSCKMSSGKDFTKEAELAWFMAFLPFALLMLIGLIIQLLDSVKIQLQIAEVSVAFLMSAAYGASIWKMFEATYKLWQHNRDIPAPEKIEGSQEQTK